MERITAARRLGSLVCANGTVEVTADILFRETDQRTLELDLYRPTSGTDHPFVVFAHGGAWRRGDKGKKWLFPELVSNGIAVADVQYRLSSEAAYPAAVRDVSAAVKWVRVNADEYDLDPGSGALAGTSSGAHLAALVGLAPGRKRFQPIGIHRDVPAAVDAVIGFSGPYDLRTVSASNPSVAMFLGGDVTEDTLAEASPVTHVDGGDPPVLLFHGTDDDVVPHASSTTFAEKVREAGGTAETFLAERADHNLLGDPDWRGDVARRFRSFYSRHVGESTHGPRWR